MNKLMQEAKNKSVEELTEELMNLRRELFNLRMQIAVQQNNKTSELKRVRRDIARYLTLLAQREQQGAGA